MSANARPIQWIEISPGMRRLNKCVVVSVEIECSNCGAGILSEFTSQWWACRDLERRGWRVSKEGQALCPRCAQLED